jgi:hypothetical protein
MYYLHIQILYLLVTSTVSTVSLGGKRPQSGSINSLKQQPATKTIRPGSSKEKIMEDSYIRHLQQQIQILELETRLRSAASVGESSATETAIKGFSPLEDMLRGLKRKYTEMQDSHDAKIKELDEKITGLMAEVEEHKLLSAEAKKDKDAIKQDSFSARGKYYLL